MNKQIEEMAKIKRVLNKTCKRVRNAQEDYMQDRYAEALYNAGYRKQIEGEWIEDEVEADCPTHFFHNYTCSVCGNHEQDRSPYCRECGAKMKGE